MQENVIRSDPLTSITVGRESEEMCLLAKFFNGFANSTRLSILLLLSQRGEMKVGELVSELGAPQPRVSDHLRCLSWCGYVRRCYGITSIASRPARMAKASARGRLHRRLVAVAGLETSHPGGHVGILIQG